MLESTTGSAAGARPRATRDGARLALPPGMWDDAPLGDLIDHIVATYHRPLPTALAAMQPLARRALGAAVADDVAELRELLVEHTRREEELVFPWLRLPDQCGAALLVNLLEQEHGDTLHRIGAVRALIDERAVTAPRSVRALSAGLRALERGLDEHIRLENRVLFPRALAVRVTSG